MTRQRQTLGRGGEELAARFLESKGYRILARRYRTRAGEVDLIARHRDAVVFVEVKTRRGTGYGVPQESVHPLKQARLSRVAASFLAGHPFLAEQDLCFRFDVVAILCRDGEVPSLEHIEDAFRAG